MIGRPLGFPNMKISSCYSSLNVHLLIWSRRGYKALLIQNLGLADVFKFLFIFQKTVIVIS